MIAIDGPLPPYCPNCAAAVHGPYCAQCGQETAPGVPTLRQFGHEYVQTFVTLEGRLWRTLWLLIRRPGQLTVEFLAGRRRRYVRPLPLYLSLSFLFFLVLSLTVDKSGFAVYEPTASTAPAPARASNPSATGAQSAVEPILNVPAWLEPTARRYARSAQRFEQDPKQASQQLTAVFLARLPYAMFFLVPAFAVATRLVYRKRRRSYTEHLLFALHLHAFFFLYLTAAQVLPGDALTGLMLFAWWFYLTVALRRVFAGRWLAQTLRALTLMLSHSLLLAGAMLAILAASLPSVA